MLMCGWVGENSSFDDKSDDGEWNEDEVLRFDTRFTYGPCWFSRWVPMFAEVMERSK